VPARRFSVGVALNVGGFSQNINGVLIGIRLRQEERKIVEKEYKSWIDNCLRCGKPMRTNHTGNHYCLKCRRAHKFTTGRGLPWR